jgi:hypothetical protein
MYAHRSFSLGSLTFRTERSRVFLVPRRKLPVAPARRTGMCVMYAHDFPNARKNLFHEPGSYTDCDFPTNKPHTDAS